MNRLKSTIALICFGMASTIIAQTQSDSTGLPGDHFSLPGALEMFKKASSLEDFEKKLNAESNNVNNLDLNGDGDIDYVRVNDKVEKDAHAIVLQVMINEKESQDVAVIEIEKNGDKSALLQIVGDDQLYEANTIVEPFDEKEVKSGTGPEVRELFTKRIIVNVWYWPCVTYIYAPVYVPWVSPWYWHHYPVWWSPWRPYPWYKHHHHCHGYKMNFHPTHTHRVVVAHRVYAPHRRSSVVVATRYKGAHESRSAYKAKNMNKPNQTVRTKEIKNKPAHQAKPSHQTRSEKPHHQSGTSKPRGGGQTKGNKGGKGGRR